MKQAPFTALLTALALALLVAGAPGAVAQAPDTWAGTWVRGDDHIKLVRKGREIHAMGSAYYPQLNHYPYPNVGELEGKAVPVNGKLDIKQVGDGEVYCQLIMQRRGNMLEVINHHSGCGGTNVSFKGTYRRLEDSGRALRRALDRLLRMPDGLNADPAKTAAPYLPQGMQMSHALDILKGAGFAVDYPFKPGVGWGGPKGVMRAWRTVVERDGVSGSAISFHIVIEPRDHATGDHRIGKLTGSIHHRRP